MSPHADAVLAGRATASSPARAGLRHAGQSLALLRGIACAASYKRVHCSPVPCTCAAASARGARAPRCGRPSESDTARPGRHAPGRRRRSQPAHPGPWTRQRRRRAHRVAGVQPEHRGVPAQRVGQRQRLPRVLLQRAHVRRHGRQAPQRARQPRQARAAPARGLPALRGRQAEVVHEHLRAKTRLGTV